MTDKECIQQKGQHHASPLIYQRNPNNISCHSVEEQ